jgi:hypothetical protein
MDDPSAISRSGPGRWADGPLACGHGVDAVRLGHQVLGGRHQGVRRAEQPFAVRGVAGEASQRVDSTTMRSDFRRSSTRPVRRRRWRDTTIGDEEQCPRSVVVAESTEHPSEPDLAKSHDAAFVAGMAAVGALIAWRYLPARAETVTAKSAV